MRLGIPDNGGPCVYIVATTTRSPAAVHAAMDPPIDNTASSRCGEMTSVVMTRRRRPSVPEQLLDGHERDRRELLELRLVDLLPIAEHRDEDRPRERVLRPFLELG